MRILVTGGAGFLGSVLVPKLLQRGHQVRVLDAGYFGADQVPHEAEFIRDDIRNIFTDSGFAGRLLADVECILHLAAISNDPSAELDPALTDEVNFRATHVLAEHAKARNIRFVFSSSCSVYGEASEQLVDEEGSLGPISAYAVSKVSAESSLHRLANSAWRPISLRNGTLSGYSPRMRFDLVVNTFAFASTTKNRIQIFGEGLQWRPLLHVADCADAFIYFSEHEYFRYLVYNIAHENLRVKDLVSIYTGLNPQLEVTYVPSAGNDARNYRVSNQRMRSAGFSTKFSAKASAKEVVNSIRTGLIAHPEDPRHWTASYLKQLLQNQFALNRAAAASAAG